jgi:hypothetical protein
MDERRRTERYDAQGEPVWFPASLGVRILDISVGGVLLQASRPVDVGTRGALRLTVSGHSFTTEVAVTRVTAVSPAPDTQFRVAAQFIALSPEDRHVIEHFTN